MDSKLEKRFKDYLETCTKKKFWSKKNIVYGNPDFFCPALKIAFFIDGDLFHNKKVILAKKIRQKTFKKKLLLGVKRDRIVTKQLKDSNWTVVRISETEIKQHPEYCINVIKKVLARSENSNQSNF